MSLLPKSIHRCRRYPTKFNSGRDIPQIKAGSEAEGKVDWFLYFLRFALAAAALSARSDITVAR